VHRGYAGDHGNGAAMSKHLYTVAHVRKLIREYNRKPTKAERERNFKIHVFAFRLYKDFVADGCPERSAAIYTLLNVKRYVEQNEPNLDDCVLTKAEATEFAYYVLTDLDHLTPLEFELATIDAVKIGHKWASGRPPSPIHGDSEDLSK
jgi:hypothetical protein